jgi:hypothetical protein
MDLKGIDRTENQRREFARVYKVDKKKERYKIAYKCDIISLFNKADWVN